MCIVLEKVISLKTIRTIVKPFHKQFHLPDIVRKVCLARYVDSPFARDNWYLFLYSMPCRPFASLISLFPPEAAAEAILSIQRDRRPFERQFKTYMYGVYAIAVYSYSAVRVFTQAYTATIAGYTPCSLIDASQLRSLLSMRFHSLSTFGAFM